MIDVHLPISLSKFLDRQENCSARHVNQILQKWHTTDSDISKFADENNLVVITKDGHFKNSHFINQTPKKVIRIILGNISNTDLILIFTRYLSLITPLSDQKNFYVEIDEEQLIINNLF